MLVFHQAQHWVRLFPTVRNFVNDVVEISHDVINTVM